MPALLWPSAINIFSLSCLPIRTYHPGMSVWTSLSSLASLASSLVQTRPRHICRDTHTRTIFDSFNNYFCIFKHIVTQQPFSGDKKGLTLPGSLHDSHSAIIHWAQEIIFPSISSFLMQPNRIWVPSFRNQFDLTNDSKSDIRPSCNLRSSQHVRGWFDFSWDFHQNSKEMKNLHLSQGISSRWKAVYTSKLK